MTKKRKGKRELGGYGRFADSALAGENLWGGILAGVYEGKGGDTDKNDVFDIFKRHVWLNE